MAIFFKKMLVSRFYLRGLRYLAGEGRRFEAGRGNYEFDISMNDFMAQNEVGDSLAPPRYSQVLRSSGDFVGKISGRDEPPAYSS